MKGLPRDTWVNVRAGSRLARLRAVPPGTFRVSLDQLVLLVLLDLLLSMALDLLDSLPHPEFYAGAVTAFGLDTLLFLLATALVARLWLTPDRTLELAVRIYSTFPFCYLVWFLLHQLALQVPDPRGYWEWGVDLSLLSWVLLVIARCVFLLSRFSWRLFAAPVLFVVVWMLPTMYLAPDTMFWYAAEEDREDPYAAYRALDGESMLFDQRDMLDAGVAQLAGQRDGVTDLYFLGFSGYAHEDVFLREIRYARRLFDARFDTRGRSLLLTNHLSTWESTPLATATNLRYVLARLGRLMDTENDVLVLFLTSHGSPQNLAVRFWPLPLNTLTPGKLREDLDAAGIKWRIVMVSACYSGGFIEALADPYTLVLTAAAADRNSFGCSNDSDMTYFGEALLRHQLQKQYSIEAAFNAAAAEIRAREEAEHLEPSHPGIFIGAEMRAKLATLAAELPGRN